ncbi:Peptidoglycan O-acetyltransferase [Legionella parisiensis]|uniref:Peptidoglycan O-acetyltransferase n=1 Tax=Legionella parisiensis TaxID=45071 RepID=A0A1E5JML0_9GAMM|nr:Peptidoglycan O-acetyltransferase [Legionella parisiensis]OEH45278.1 Peptidoglycan O-acetyltransferase [Legionella parisiensis]STX75998.1 Uncharacterised protein [Legionella parisiensis]
MVRETSPLPRQRMNWFLNEEVECYLIHLFLSLCIFLLFSSVRFFAKYNNRLAEFWLVLANLVFYSMWNVKFLTLLLMSVIFNYMTSYLIARTVIYKKTALILPFQSIS